MTIRGNYGNWSAISSVLDPYAEARATLTSYEQTCALTAALMQCDLDHLRYKTKPDVRATVDSYMSALRYVTPHTGHIGTPVGVIMNCAMTPLGSKLPIVGRRVCSMMQQRTKRDAVTLRIFEVQVTLLEGGFGLRCAMNFAAIKAEAERRAPLFSGKRYA